ncbi:CRAL-TRIO domain-containing protein [Gautieria morchelliformis]|nr:CRAL-TRIO domain-containing protein [Gautieria morchelliformis]
MLSYLQAKYDAVIALHHARYEAALGLQAALRSEVLGDLVAEHQLDERCVSCAREWIDDYGSIFRMYKKHHFDPAETRNALESTLRWRISELPCLQVAKMEGVRDPSSDRPLFIQHLPDPVRDVFGRPVLLVHLGKLLDASLATKHEIVRVLEEIRQRLRTHGDCEQPTLQYVAIVDFEGVAMRSMALELIPWFIREVAPRYPGMCAAVFVVNYFWAYGMYNVVKRLLPANVLSRIYFPSPSELLSCIESHCLPREYGGVLDTSPTPADSSSLATEVERPSDLPHPNTQLSHFLPSMSMLNPYFGYPVMTNPGSSVPSLINGRRRKRDLVRTLALLWIAKLKRLTDHTWMWIILTLVLWAVEVRTTCSMSSGAESRSYVYRVYYYLFIRPALASVYDRGKA